MKYIFLTIKILGIVLSLIVIVSLFLPNKTLIERNIEINSGIDGVENYLRNLKKWKQWSAWNIKNTDEYYTSYSPHLGDQLSWFEGNTSNGTLIMKQHIPKSSIAYKMILGDNDIIFYGMFLYKENDNKVILNWKLKIDYGWNPVLKIFGFFEHFYARDMDNSMTRLKKVVETSNTEAKTVHDIQILYDNFLENPELEFGWGFSCLINKNILFDTGESFQKLMSNIKQMNIDLDLIDKIIISHDHWDHTGGLLGLIDSLKNLKKIYVCSDIDPQFKAAIIGENIDLIEVNESIKIDENVFSTGVYDCMYKDKNLSEQSLILKLDENNIGLITGCAHPGIVKMIDNNPVLKTFNIEYLLGGLHLIKKTEAEILNIAEMLKSYGIKQVFPTHCSGKQGKDAFHRIFRTAYHEVGVGSRVEFK